MVIRPTDRVSAVLARDERLIEVFVGASPAFERLRSPALGKVMARLVTVGQAARMAGIDTAELVARLETALASGGAEPAPVADRVGPSPAAASPPAALAAAPPGLVVELDVRPELRRGEEPFSKIMAARRSLPEDGILCLRTTFEPVPLYAVLGKQGFAHWTERFADDDWRVWFHLASEGKAAGVAPTIASAAGGAAAAEGDDVVILDVRGLEPPEPMQRTLEALETLPAGMTLVQLNVREPRFLLPLLAERGWSYEVRRQDDALVRTLIRRASAA